MTQEAKMASLASAVVWTPWWETTLSQATPVPSSWSDEAVDHRPPLELIDVGIVAAILSCLLA